MRGVVISVNEVRVTADLSSARVYLSVFPDEQKELLMQEIKRETSALRGVLGSRIKSQVRHIPELIFEYDTSGEYARRIEAILNANPVSPLPEEEEDDEYDH